MIKEDRLLRIEHPCAENWAAMENHEQGKYCAHCSKQVLDFTALSDEKIVQVIQKQEGKICGRFKHTQLNRLLAVPRKQNTAPVINKWLAGMLVLLSMKHAAADNPDRKEKPAVVMYQHCPQPAQPENEKAILSDSLKNVFSGTIADEQTKEVLAAASLRIQGSSEGVMADLDGKFIFKIPPELLKDTIVFEISYVGYHTRYYVAQKNELQAEQEVLYFPTLTLLPYEMMGEVVIVKKKRWWRFWR